MAVFLLKDLRFRCCFMLSATSWLFRLDFSKPTTTLVLSSCVPTIVLWTLEQHCNWHVESHEAYTYEHHGKPGLIYTFMGSFLRLSEFCNIEKDRVGWIAASKIEVLLCLLSFQHFLLQKKIQGNKWLACLWLPSTNGSCWAFPTSEIVLETPVAFPSSYTVQQPC